MPRQPIPPGFDGIVLRCLAKNPDDRYQTAGALCRSLMKLRGQLAGMADDLVGSRSKKASGTRSGVATNGVWSPLTTLREPLVGMLDVDPPEVSPMPSAGEETRRVMKLAVSSRDLRQELHDTLRELAFSVSESSIRTDELSPVLNRLLQLEEEGRVLKGKTSVLEQNFDRIRFEFGEQETMLRYAVLDLRVLYNQAIDPTERAAVGGAPTQADDLMYQIEALQQRIEDVGDERATRIASLNQEIQGYRQAKAEREEEAARLHTELHVMLEGVRDQATAGNMTSMYKQLDELSKQLQLARQSVRIMRHPR